LWVAKRRVSRIIEDLQDAAIAFRKGADGMTLTADALTNLPDTPRIPCTIPAPPCPRQDKLKELGGDYVVGPDWQPLAGADPMLQACPAAAHLAAPCCGAPSVEAAMLALLLLADGVCVSHACCQPVTPLTHAPWQWRRAS